MRTVSLLVMLVVLFALVSACRDGKGTIKVLTQEGYTQIEVGGYDFFGCGKDDTFATKFTATNAHGKRVRGVVCSGFMKGRTIRFH